MEYALCLLPYIMQAPLRKTKRYSSDESAKHFIQFHPYSYNNIRMFMANAQVTELLGTYNHGLTWLLLVAGCLGGRPGLLAMNTAMETIIDSFSPEFNHPLVIALGNRGNINQLFIAVEKQVIAVQHGLANAVCRLMQLYYMLDMEYAEPAKHILHFLQIAVMTVDDQLPLCLSGSGLSLYIKKG